MEGREGVNVQSNNGKYWTLYISVSVVYNVIQTGVETIQGYRKGVVTKTLNNMSCGFKMCTAECVV